METPGGAREVARIAWPLAVGMFSFTLMGVVDTLLMGHVSTTAQAGVAVATMVVITFIAFYRGVASGAQALVAAAHGARDPLRIRAAGTAAVLFALVLGVLATATIRLVAAPTLGWVVGDPDVAAAGRRYLEVRAFAVPMSMLSFGLLASIQGLGDTRTQMWVSLAGNVVNAVVGVLLVFGLGPFPRLEEAGAGWSTVAGAATMASLYALRFRSRIGKVLRPSREVITSVLTIGVPAGVQNLLGVSAFVVMNVALARAGQVELAASQVVFQIISLSFLPGAGIGEAGGVLLGRYLGAGQPEVAGRTLESARRIAIGVMSVFGLIFFFFGRPIASLFTEDPAVVERGRGVDVLRGLVPGGGRGGDGAPRRPPERRGHPLHPAGDHHLRVGVPGPGHPRPGALLRLGRHWRLGGDDAAGVRGGADHRAAGPPAGPGHPGPARSAARAGPGVDVESVPVLR
ncbi:MAG: MATE family efflux transporter [Deltaproteobacteria bacterium]|nr:MATE family efflux transporter [Deltaproteobacteria bacterium]